MRKIAGTVQSGVNDANKWLRRFAKVYAEWLGQEVFPGSLNVETGCPFDWHDQEVLPYRRRFSLLPHGGERDIFMIPCSIILPARQACWLWTTTAGADNRPDSTVVELVAPVNIRSSMSLVDGSKVEIQYPEEWANNSLHRTGLAPSPAGELRR